jgi:hypothetical protein
VFLQATTLWDKVVLGKGQAPLQSPGEELLRLFPRCAVHISPISCLNTAVHLLLPFLHVSVVLFVQVKL